MLSADDVRKAIEEAKKNPNGVETDKSFESKREEAMKSYLDDVSSVSQFINEEFAKIDAKTLTKKDGSINGR
ncbi:MAG: hypothetical protein IJN90_07355 [Bacilli bacterium]|nr:hypothetical protein [Bacilli bacterium]